MLAHVSCSYCLLIVVSCQGWFAGGILLVSVVVFVLVVFFCWCFWHLAAYVSSSDRCKFFVSCCVSHHIASILLRTFMFRFPQVASKHASSIVVFFLFCWCLCCACYLSGYMITIMLITCSHFPHCLAHDTPKCWWVWASNPYARLFCLELVAVGPVQCSSPLNRGFGRSLLAFLGNSKSVNTEITNFPSTNCNNLKTTNWKDICHIVQKFSSAQWSPAKASMFSNHLSHSKQACSWDHKDGPRKTELNKISLWATSASTFPAERSPRLNKIENN